MIVFGILLPFLVIFSKQNTCSPFPGTPSNSPIGEGKGRFPGRVAWGLNKRITKWNGKNDTAFWEEDNTDVLGVNVLLISMMKKFFDEEDLRVGWRKLFLHFNKEHFGKEQTYVKGEKIVIKVNINGMWTAQEQKNANQLTPQFLLALITMLVRLVKVNEEDIVIYDASRVFPDQFWNFPTGLSEFFPDVKFVDNTGRKNWTQQVQVDFNSKLIFSSDEVPDRFGTKLPKCVTEAKYMISIANLRGHISGGITASGKNHFGSIYRPDCTCDAEPLQKNNHFCPRTLHQVMSVRTREMGTYNPFIDLLGHKDLGAKTILFFVEGLYGGATQDPEDPVRFSSPPFNGHWSSSILVSEDPIALDSVSYDILRNEKNVPYASAQEHPDWCIDNYLHEAALADHPPSNTIYNPTGYFNLTSLGVHEHWNNNIDKQYSRNLGKEEGIELIKVWK